MADSSARPTTQEAISSAEDPHSEFPSSTSTPASPDDQPSSTPPTPRSSFEPPKQIMSSASGPLGPTNAARRPGPPPARASGLTSDIQAKMKAFSLSRQGTPTAGQNHRPGMGSQPSLSTGRIPSPAFTPSSPGGPVAGVLRLPPGLQKSNGPNWNSAPPSAAASPRIAPRPGVGGGLAAKRGLKGPPGGMTLSNAMKADPKPSGDLHASPPRSDTGSQFNKYSNIIDTQKGTLNFENKAIIHGGGIDFSTGSSFSISLDEIDAMDELGKGNYGTVFKVKHARPKMRRPGMGLRGNMQRTSSASMSSVDSDDSTASASAAGTSGVVMAMKEMRLELEDSKFASIIMELDVLHRCISPFIVSFYGAFFQEGSVYICMEFMDGGSLDKLYGDGIPESVLKKVTLSTIMGLKCLKDDHNIIHRDVKPTNILINTRGQVKICDFGVSGNLVASIAKTNIGCQSYMAPERISGGGMAQAGATGGTYSVQSDIWSLGLTIIECALGRYPYPPETYDNIFSQLSAIVDGDPPDLPSESFSEVAHDFVHGCLNKIPKSRPTYAMLLRHPWLAPLLKPPTISEDDEAEAAAEAAAESGADFPSGDINGHPDTADKEVADWVKRAIQRKLEGKMKIAGKPALHAAPLDAMPGSPLLDRGGVDQSTPLVVPKAREGVKLESPELKTMKVQSLDFADGVSPGVDEHEKGMEGTA